MPTLDKRVANLERTSSRRNFTTMSDEQLLACLNDPHNPDRMAAMMERIRRTGGSRLPVRVVRAA
jgi:hypothetical protein